MSVNLNPKNDLYYHTLGNCLRKLKKHKEAIQMYEKGKEIKKLNDIVNNSELEKKIEEDSKINNYNQEEAKNNIYRKTKTFKETNKTNMDKIDNNINESGLVSHIKEVLKGKSVKNLINKLDFVKASTMKSKLEIYNKK